MRWVSAGFRTVESSEQAYIVWSNRTSSGRSSNLVGKNLVSDLLQVTIGEDEANIALDMGQETLILWRVSDKAFNGAANLDVAC